MNLQISPAQTIRGRISVPGDKSISHRALMLGAIADGQTCIRGMAAGEDVRSTLRCLRQLGVKIEDKNSEVTIDGRGLGGLQKPIVMLDAGNSGTTMRLFAGILATQPFATTITGDASLRRRPMRRIIEPLTKMGASIAAEKNWCAPLMITGGMLQGIRYQLPVASAQVKSCVLFAGLGAEGETIVEETMPTRDHSERLLRLMGASLSVISDQLSVTSGQWEVASGKGQLTTDHGKLNTDNRQRLTNKICIRAGRLNGIEIDVPGDFSSSAFFIAAALLLRESELVIENVGVNPTRVAFLEVLRQMGARIEISNLRNASVEPAADLFIGHQRLQGITVSGHRIPLLIDEIPILAVLATQAEGETLIREAGELRVKESDRLAALAQNLRAMGASIDELPEGLIVRGPTKLRGATINSFGDHRIAMAFALAALVADSPTTICGAECADVSFPGFFETLRTVCV